MIHFELIHKSLYNKQYFYLVVEINYDSLLFENLKKCQATTTTMSVVPVEWELNTYLKFQMNYLLSLSSVFDNS